jgi:hypothetical protein
MRPDHSGFATNCQQQIQAARSTESIPLKAKKVSDDESGQQKI